MLGKPMYYAGLKIVVNPNLVKVEVKQIKFPRSKCKRIRKKFRKKFTVTNSVPDTNMYQMGCTVVCHPSVYKKLRNH